MPLLAPVLPPLAIAVYLVCCAGAGLLANVAVVAALFRRERNGIHIVVMQLAIADALLLCGAAGFETWSRNEGAWPFGGAACVSYLGLEAFASAASAYFAVTLALHALATAAREDAATAAAETRPRSGDEDSDVEVRSSRRSLVDSSTAPRTMRIDYRTMNPSLSVAAPVVFVWVLAASLSVPRFALAAAVRLESGVAVCSFGERSPGASVQASLAAFGLFVPAFLLTSASALATVRLSARRRRGESEAKPALALAVALAVVYVTLVAPRSALTAYEALAAPHDSPGGASGPLGDSVAPPAVGLALSCLSYAAALLRPLLSIFLLPDLRCSFSFKGRPRLV